ncbi:MAG: roadblock/LC7 domain-containing protein [Gemmatimonadales bacterium]|nr:roadblock/LC7 domain-containing protein [Gemmatimonadales bacterium]
MSPHSHVLRRVSSVRGIRGAMVVSADGLVVAEALMEGIDGRAVAALAASLAGRLARTTASAALGALNVVHLRGEHGVLLAVPAGPELLVVAVGDPAANLGLARLEMLEAARGLR